jgi:hypothetical protein
MYGLWVGRRKCCCGGILNKSESGASSERKTTQKTETTVVSLLDFDGKERVAIAAASFSNERYLTKERQGKGEHEEEHEAQNGKGKVRSRREAGHHLRFMAATTDEPCWQASTPTPMFHWRPAEEGYEQGMLGLPYRRYAR